MGSYLKVIQEIYNSYGLAEEDLLILTKSNVKQIVWSSVINLGYKGRPMEISQLKEKRGQKFKKSGISVADKLYKMAIHLNREIRLVIIELGDMKLYCAETTKAVRGMLLDLFDESPRYVKIERSDTRNNMIHAHMIVAIDPKYIFPEEHSGYKIKYEKLGARDEYKNVSLNEQVRRFVKYLQKPADARANCRRLDLRKEVCFEWFIDNFEKRNGVSKEKNPRLSWSTGLKRL